jgi:hypothetical protein
VILGEYEHISEGDTVKCTGRILEGADRPGAEGRVVNALGLPIDGKGPINAKLSAPIEKIAPGVIARQSVSQPMQTGLKAIDSMVPIGPRPARADHRRPPDRQERRRDRRDHQPEGSEHDLRLRRDRPEGVVGQERGARARSQRRDGVHDRRRGDRAESAAMQYISPTPAARWASTSATAAKTR